MAFFSKYKVTLAVGFLLVLIFGLVLFSEMSRSVEVGCTMEAKICPDGSAVGREGPMCEFAKCPGDNGGAVGEFWGSIQGTVLLGPTCPVMMDPPDPQCADKPYATRFVLTTADQSRVIKEFSSNAQGRFNVEVPPGEYAIRSAVVATILRVKWNDNRERK
jgi:hypothetical protein